MSETSIPPAPAIEGAEHLHSGKVRDLYRLTEGPHAGRLLMVASDRISAFDHVLDPAIPDKGAILSRMSLWWFDQLADLVPHHVVSLDVPAGLEGRAVVCEPLEMFPVECVVRGYLTGSGLREYAATGEVCGIALPEGLVDGSRLPEPIFTPATKAELGEHDENVSFEAVVDTVGAEVAATLRDLTLAVYARAEELARGRGIILADTKLEFGRRSDGTVVLADEVLTPDSSRFWSVDDWEPGRAQPSFDKDNVRNWLLSPASGWDKESDEVPPRLPDDVVERTRSRYLAAYEQAHRAGVVSGGTVELAVPPEVAFDWFADPVNRPLWQASLRRVEDVDGTPRDGQTWVDVTKPGLRPQMRTTRFERPRVWAESGTWRGVRADLTMTFEADQGGCLARVDFRIHLPGPLRRAGALVSLVSAPAVLLDVRKAGRLLAEVS